MSKSPWMKFYPSDWQGDEALQMASLAARGLWIECLCIMHNNGGYLQVGNQPVTERNLSIKVGVEVEQITELLSELENLGVFSRTRKGVIFSRRMLSDLQKSQKSRKNGQKGGNPSLCDKRKNQTWDNPEDKPPDKRPRGQKPDAREKKGYTDVYPKKTKSGYPDEFERWYQNYPHKVGKLEAYRAFQKARQKADLQTLIEGVEHYKRTKPPDQKYCNPATWLNQERWLDQPAQQPEGDANGTTRRAGYDPREAHALALQDQTRRPRNTGGQGVAETPVDPGELRGGGVLDRPAAKSLSGPSDG